MTGNEAIKVYETLSDSGIDTWVEGGWAVEALVPKLSWQHDDLDLVVSLANVERLQPIFTQLGYVSKKDKSPSKVDFKKDRQDKVTVHLVQFNQDGTGFRPFHRVGIKYEASHFSGEGVIQGKSVRCLTPDALINRYQKTAFYKRRDKKIVAELSKLVLSHES